METFESFNEKVIALNEEIKKHYADFSKANSMPIWDGVANAEEYFKSEIKILWILKEPYDIDNEGEGGWNIAELIDKEGFLNGIGGGKTTWHSIIYTSYSILNGFILYDNLSFIEKEPTMADVLKKIAFINVQKFPAGTTSINSDISSAYQQHKEVLLKQIETYNPDIIIGGSTMWNFVKDLELEGNKKYDEYEYWIKDRLYIDANHPAYPKSDEAKEAYVDDIVRIAKRYWEEKSSSLNQE